MSLRTCLIHQPGGLGDILWLQPIVNKLIDLDYQIYFPVVDIYYEMLNSQIQKKNLFWKKQNDDFPLKEHYGKNYHIKLENELYLPISFANYMLPNCSNMMSKYYYTQTPITNWHKSFEIIRNPEKEQRVFDIYNIDINKPFVFLNMSYGTPPHYKTRKIDLNTNHQILNLSIEKNQSNNISIFDCLLAIENAYEIHTVETSVCHLADKYAKTEHLYMYEKRLDNEPNTYYSGDNKVYRNPYWTFNCF